MMEEKVFKEQSSSKWKWCKLTFRAADLHLIRKQDYKYKPFKSWKKQASPSLKPQETGSDTKGKKTNLCKYANSSQRLG